jgi:hypothetical protein
MSKTTSCFTYGETRTSTLAMNGALVTLAEYKSACGEWSEDAFASPPDVRKKRPSGVCPRCFAAYNGAK